jgi:hypothetical protein
MDKHLCRVSSAFCLIQRSNPAGIVTLTKNGPNLLLDHEVKPLKMNIPTIGESPRFRCESD